MSEYYPPPPQEPGGNPMGIAGFVVSLVGILLCGLISPIGLILSLIGLGKEPKGLAIAGTVVGGLGTLLFVIFGIGLIVGLLVGVPVEDDPSLDFAVQMIETRADLMGELPSKEEGQEMIAEIEDEWGRALRYEPEDDTFLIRSAGPDGEFDTHDDLVAIGDPQAKR